MTKKIVYVVIVLIIVVIVTGGLIAFYFVSGAFPSFSTQTEEKKGTNKITTAGNEYVKKISLSIDALYGDVEIVKSTSDSDFLFNLDWTHKFNANDDATKLTVTNSSSADVLEISIKIEYQEDSFPFNTDKWNLDIALNPNLEEYGFDIDLTTGDLSFTFSEATINLLGLETTTGEITASLTDCTITNGISLIQTTGSLDLSLITSTLTGDMSTVQSTGEATITIKNLLLTEDIQITMDQTTGGTSIDWTQTVALTHDVDFNSESSTGEFSMTITSPASLTRYDVQGSVTTGDFTVSGISKITDNHYKSDNYDDISMDAVDIIATTTTGDIDITINDE